MRKKFRKLGIIQKIAIAMTLIILLPSITVGAYAYYTNSRKLHKEADGLLEDSIRTVGSDINSSISEVQNAMNEIEYRMELLYFMDRQSIFTEKEISTFLLEIQEEWLNIQQIYPSLFEQMNLYSSNPAIEMGFVWKLSLYPMGEFPELAEAEKYDKLWYGDIKYSGTLNEETKSQFVEDEDMILPAYLNIRNISTDQIIGIVELDIPFNKVVNTDSLNSAKKVSYLFTNRKGNIIYQNGVKFSEKDIQSITCIQNQVSGCSVNGEQYRILASQNEETGITSYAFIEEQEITKSGKKLLVQIWVIIFLALLLIVAITYFILKQMLNRLVVMDEAMQKLGSGDFHVHFEEDGYEDEVSRIKWQFQHMANRLEEVTNEVIEREQAQKEAELKALQAQINPHFLFNTIDTMHMQCEIDRSYKVGNALMSLGEMFRYTIRWEENQVPFSGEWENLKNYIALMKLRFDDDLDCEMTCKEETLLIPVPKMFLQPLVENSFQHGFKGVLPPWKLRIHAFMQGEALAVQIRDNGSGISGERMEEVSQAVRFRKPLKRKDNKQQSIGVINVIQRIDRICGPGSDIRIRSREKGGVEIDILIIPQQNNNLSENGEK